MCDVSVLSLSDTVVDVLCVTSLLLSLLGPSGWCLVCDVCVALQENWEFKLYIDERQQALLVGTTVSQDTCVTVGIYNRHGWVAPLENVFYPP